MTQTENILLSAVCGASQSGKTPLVRRMIARKFTITKTLYGANKVFQQMVLKKKELNLFKDYPEKFESSLVIIDDLIIDLKRKIAGIIHYSASSSESA
ncbi:hypothetical protein AVEN_149628-1 [Araneus ventricosus]|uniref:Uncharacterized protein n=1 Tax=Araneus ventricosus TaxID=182803 RepID=A0A4Y2A184_ARAVE|nr:hypothetical protein AVEN_149628-1 [Araneus ventricosus]